jgi:hypothetical protein
VRLAKISTGGLVIGEQAAQPEQINEAPIVGELFEWLLEGGDGALRTPRTLKDIYILSSSLLRSCRHYFNSGSSKS